MGVDKRKPVDQWGGRTTASGVWVGPRRKAGTPNVNVVDQIQKEAVASGYAKPNWTAVRSYMTQYPQGAGAAPAAAPTRAPTNTGGGRSSGGGGGGWGGGGGGGGGNAAATTAAQTQIDSLSQLLASGAYKFNPDQYAFDASRFNLDTSPYDRMRTGVNEATAADQAAATGAYNNLDTYLQQNQRNPYADVKLQQAERAPDMNPYLATQGVQGTNYQASNPEDQGYGAFQNILSLLSGNQQAGQQSRQAESQMARTYAGQQIGALDNAYLSNIQGQQTQAQQQMDQARIQAQQQMDQQRMQAQQSMETERRQALLQMMQLLATPGTKGPDMAQFGY
jgi:hypothetical protein